MNFKGPAHKKRPRLTQTGPGDKPTFCAPPQILYQAKELTRKGEIQHPQNFCSCLEGKTEGQTTPAAFALGKIAHAAHKFAQFVILL